jgi:two-component system sensor histidine kinase/response regulator
MVDIDLKTANILIVDDQLANIEVLEGLLDMQGYTNYKSTTDPRDVAGLMTSFNPDIILLDLSMPFMSGFEVMEQIKTIKPADLYMPILVLTADVTTESKKRALSVGASDFVTKPFDLTEVSLRIKNLLFANYLQQRLQNQNQILEEKVLERTRELEQTNAQLVVARDKAQASDKLKTAFMHNISHEVRTPLNGILGFGALICDPDFSNEDKVEYYGLLQFSSNRLINTITDYMDISLIVSDNIDLKWNEIRLQDIINDSISKFSQICQEKNIALEYSLPTDLAGVKLNTDRELTSKILDHLIDNAVKFTRQGSIKVGITKLDNEFEFFVKDTGVGIEEEAQQRIFETFMQEDLNTTRGHEGSGLGLSIVLGFLKLIGGTIRLESTKNIGSTFYFTLPIDPDAPKKPLFKPSVHHANHNGLPVILIVEDEYANRVYLEIILRKHVSVIYLATNGAEAVNLCREHPEISLVLMDIKMPVMNGIDATHLIKQFRKDLPVIAVTAHGMHADETNILESGFDDYLAKPCQSDDLMKKLIEYGLEIK